jgi:hypothetical protein
LRMSASDAQRFAQIVSLETVTGRPFMTSTLLLRPHNGKLKFNVPVQLRRCNAGRCNRLSGVIVPLTLEYNMGGLLRRNELNALVSECA